MVPPELGLGATAVRAWLQKRREEGLPATAVWLSDEVKAAPSSVHEWLTAGWTDGGSVPKPAYRKRLAALSGNPEIEALFDQDDERRLAAKRPKATPSDRPEAAS